MDTIVFNIFKNRYGTICSKDIYAESDNEYRYASIDYVLNAIIRSGKFNPSNSNLILVYLNNRLNRIGHFVDKDENEKLCNLCLWSKIVGPTRCDRFRCNHLYSGSYYFADTIFKLSESTKSIPLLLISKLMSKFTENVLFIKIQEYTRIT